MKTPIGPSLLSAILICSAVAALEPPPQQPLGHVDNEEFTGGLPFSTSALEEYIGGAMEKWHAPGMAVAIINGNETWAKGFGYASLPSTPVTPHTLFWAGSTTKSFVAAALSLLVDNATSDHSHPPPVVGWATPMSQLLRDDFVLSDDWATAHVTVEDCLSHRTGYPRHDYSAADDTRGWVRNLRHLPMSAEPRTTFQYNNMMWAAAGYLVSTLSGCGLGEFLHRYLWGPMGMGETFLGDWDPLLGSSGRQLADGYLWVNSTGQYVMQPWGEISRWLRVTEGAGAVLSNVLDYTKYLRVMMAEAGPISKEGHRELKRPRTFHNFHEGLFVGPETYGLGWMSAVFEGHQVFYHTGTVVPFVTFMVMVPSKSYGIVVMANGWSHVRELVTYRVLYDLFGVEESRRRDWESHFEEEDALEAHNLATCSERIYPDLPHPPIPASVPLANHTGQFRHVAYGDISVSLECNDTGPSTAVAAGAEAGSCRLRMSRDHPERVAGYLEHKTGDFWLTFGFDEEVPEVIQACVRVQFQVDSSGIVTHIGVDLRLEGDDGPLVWFERVQ